MGRFSESDANRLKVDLRRMGAGQIRLYLFAKLLQKFAIYLSAAAAVIIINRIRGVEWNYADRLALVIIVTVVLTSAAVVLWPIRMSKTIRNYRQLIESFVQADWPRVIQLADQLAGSPISASELAFRKATALAALGCLDEALRLIHPWVSGDIIEPDSPTWAAIGRSAEVYAHGGQPDKAFAVIEEAARLAPDSAEMQLALASARILQGDVAAATLAMNEVEKLPLRTDLSPSQDFLKACLCNEQGDSHAALELLHAAREKFLGLLPAAPILAMQLTSIDYEIATAYALAGDVSQAATHYHNSAPRLRAHGSLARIARGERLTRRANFRFEEQ